MLENGAESCSCKRVQCERHGNCEACMEHHRTNKRYDPYCKRKGRRKEKPAKKDVKI